MFVCVPISIYGYLWVLRGYFEVILVLFLCFFGVILRFYLGYLGVIWGLFGGYLGVIWGLFRGYLGVFFFGGGVVLRLC